MLRNRFRHPGGPVRQIGLSYQPAGNRFLGSLKCLQIWTQIRTPQNMSIYCSCPGRPKYKKILSTQCILGGFLQIQKKSSKDRFAHVNTKERFKTLSKLQIKS
jgi:hypothetical protein